MPIDDQNQPTNNTGTTRSPGTIVFRSGATHTTFTFGAPSGRGGFHAGATSGTALGTVSFTFGDKSRSGPRIAHASAIPMDAIQPYSTFIENDGTAILQYVSITALPSYRYLSVEEMRMQVYQKNGLVQVIARKSPKTSTAKKQERLEVFLRQCLLEDTTENVRFHLFCARSSASGRVIKPRVIRANKAILSESSEYFSTLLKNLHTNSSDSPWVVLADDSDIPTNALIDYDYGYESDSDLEEDDDYNLQETPAERSSTIGTVTPAKLKDGLSETGVGPVGPSEFIVVPKQPRMGGASSADKDGATSKSSCEPGVRDEVNDITPGNLADMHHRSLECCNVLVKDTAFKTWYTLLRYLFTEKVHFLPLSSATSGVHPTSSADFRDEPKCSAKSMYRLASKAGLDSLRDEALTHIRSQLTEDNILQELSSSLVHRHPELLEMELDVLHSVITSPSIIANFSSFAQRIANKELPHGADIIVGIHSRFLKQLYPFMNLTLLAPLRSSPEEPEPEPINPPTTTSRRKRKGKTRKMVTGQQTPHTNPGDLVPSLATSPAGWIKSEEEESPPQSAYGSPSSESPKIGEISNDRL